MNGEKVEREALFLRLPRRFLDAEFMRYLPGENEQVIRQSIKITDDHRVNGFTIVKGHYQALGPPTNRSRYVTR